MKNKIPQFLITLFLIIATQQLGNCQISKGDYSIDFSGWLNHRYDDTNNDTRINLNLTYMKLVTNKLMIGGGLNYHHAANGTNESGEWENYPFNSYRFSPTIRYYFSTNRLAPFTNFQNDLSITIFEREGPWENSRGYRGIFGLGLNYFLNKNIALEGLLTSNLISLGDFKEEPNYISFRTGIKLFLNNSLQNSIESLPEKILRKGNIQTSGNLISFNHKFEETPTGHLSFAPNLRYFVTDRFNVYGNYRLTQYRFLRNNQNFMTFGLGAEYFFRVNNNLFLNLGVTGVIQFNNGQLNEIFNESYRNIDIPISSALHYFHKQKRIYFGGRYRYDNYKYLTSDRYIRKRNTFSIFTGLDYFVQENVYFKGEFDFSLARKLNLSNSLNRTNSGTLSFGVGIIIDSNKIQFKSNERKKKTEGNKG